MPSTPRPERALALKDALDKWFRQARTIYGFHTKEELGSFLEVKVGWSSISHGGAITDKYSYASLYYLTDLPEADPRTLPPFDKIIPRTGEMRSHERKMPEEEWQDWVQNSALAAKIREFKAGHSHSALQDGDDQLDVTEQETTGPSQPPIQTVQEPKPTIPNPPEAHRDSPVESPQPSSPGNVLDTLLTAIGTHLGAAMAAGMSSASIPASPAPVDPSIMQRLEVLERRDAELTELALGLTRMLTTSGNTVSLDDVLEEHDTSREEILTPGDEAAELSKPTKPDVTQMDTEVLLSELITRVQQARQNNDEQRAHFVHTHAASFSTLSNQLRRLGRRMYKIHTQTEGEAVPNSTENLVTDLIQELDRARSGNEEDLTMFMAEQGKALNTLARTLTAMGKRVTQIHSSSGKQTIKELIEELGEQLRMFVETGTPESRDELYAQYGTALTALWNVTGKLTLPRNEREQTVRAKSLGGVTP